MGAAVIEPQAEAPTGLRLPTIGFTGRVAVVWTVASGILVGGLWTALLLLAHRASASSFLPMTSILCMAGAALGFLHGALLGYVGRPAGVDTRDAARSLALAVVWAIPGFLLAWGMALWISMTGAAMTLGRSSLIATVAVGWLVGVGMCCWAAAEGYRAVRNACRRWADYRLGTGILLSTFAVLALSFAIVRPEIWGTDIRVTRVGAVLLALGATIWIAGPLVIIALHFFHRRATT